MRDGNSGEYKGSVYVAKESDDRQCVGCGGKQADGSINLAFCNAMPNCMSCDRTDKRMVVFVKQSVEEALKEPRNGSEYNSCVAWRVHAGCGVACFGLCDARQRLACSEQFTKDKANG